MRRRDVSNREIVVKQNGRVAQGNAQERLNLNTNKGIEKEMNGRVNFVGLMKESGS